MDIPARRLMEPFDALMLRGDEDPRGRSTLLGVFILDRAPDWDRLVEEYERITRLIVPLRQKVVMPPAPLSIPTWVVDADFDLSYHLRRMRVPDPGTLEALLELLEPMSMEPFDRTRPLWEFMLFEGLQDGKAAWVTKMNHAIADGVGGQALSHISFDLERDPPAKDMPPRPAPVDITPNDLLKETISRAPLMAIGAVARGVQTALRAARRPAKTVSDVAAYAGSLGRMASGPTAEGSPLMRGRSLKRRLIALEVSLDDLKAGSKAADGSLNDAFLAAVCGGVRMYHEHLGVPIDSMPIAMPISLRTDDDPAGGNRWAAARLAPPVGEKDPVERIKQIRGLVLEARDEPAVDSLSLLAPVMVRLPNWLLAAAFGGATGTIDLQVSNIPGSPVPLYLAGAEVEKTFGFGPVPGPAAMITMYSYLRTCNVGVNLDPAAITDPELFATCLEAGFDEVIALGRPPTPRPRRRTAT